MKWKTFHESQTGKDVCQQSQKALKAFLFSNDNSAHRKNVITKFNARLGSHQIWYTLRSSFMISKHFD